MSFLINSIHNEYGFLIIASTIRNKILTEFKK